MHAVSSRVPQSRCLPKYISPTGPLFEPTYEPITHADTSASMLTAQYESRQSARKPQQIWMKHKANIISFRQSWKPMHIAQISWAIVLFKPRLDDATIRTQSGGSTSKYVRALRIRSICRKQLSGGAVPGSPEQYVTENRVSRFPQPGASQDTVDSTNPPPRNRARSCMPKNPTGTNDLCAGPEI